MRISRQRLWVHTVAELLALAVVPPVALRVALDKKRPAGERAFAGVMLVATVGIDGTLAFSNLRKLSR